MIEVKINKGQVERARKLYPFKELNGSITKGESNIFGALGEILIFDYYSDADIVLESTYDYDMIINGYCVDVKTKKTTVKPQEDYLCSISAFNTKQKCDYYFFVRITTDLNSGYLLGYISKDDFYKKAIWKNKGDVDVNGFVFKDDCYNLEIKYLHEFQRTR